MHLPSRAVVEQWGSTAAERTEPFPCDPLVDAPDVVVFRAVTVNVPAAVVFRWLCQMRVAPYSYDWIDNFGRRSPRHLTPGLENLEVGQRIATIFRIVAFEPDRSITMRSRGPVFGDVAITYRVTERDDGTSRLVAKLIVAAPPGVVGWLGARLLPAGDLVMMRRQLLNFKALAERAGATARTAPGGFAATHPPSRRS